MALNPSPSRLPRARGNQPGSVSPKSWNELVDYCEQLEKRIAGLTPQSSPDIAHKVTASGFTSHLKRRGGARGGGSSKPLTLKRGTAANKVQVVSGTINGTVPTSGGTALDNATPPEITITGTMSIYAKVVGSISGGVVTYTITIETSAPTEAISATSWTTGWLLGTATYSAPDLTIYNVHSGGNLGATAFGNVTHWYKI